MWKLGIIEVNKILSKSKHDVFSLWNLIKNLESGKYPKHGISNEIILSWKKKLSASKKTLKTISDLRNKIYAHTDPEVKSKEVDITFEEVENILQIIESVIRDVYHYAFDSGIINETIVFQRDRFDIIKILAKAHKNRMEELINRCKAVWFRINIIA